jgi:hypothetical protein
MTGCSSVQPALLGGAELHMLWPSHHQLQRLGTYMYATRCTPIVHVCSRGKPVWVPLIHTPSASDAQQPVLWLVKHTRQQVSCPYTERSDQGPCSPYIHPCRSCASRCACARCGCSTMERVKRIAAQFLPVIGAKVRTRRLYLLRVRCKPDRSGIQHAASALSSQNLH